MNKTMLIGRISHDLELKYTNSGIAVTEFNLAVNRRNKDDGADFIRVQVWKTTAENLQKYQGKGSLIAVEGRIRVETYQDQQGQNRYATKVVAENVQYLESKKNNGPQETMHQPYQPQTNQFQQPAFNDPYQFQQPSFSSTIDIDDDDLPF